MSDDVDRAGLDALLWENQFLKKQLSKPKPIPKYDPKGMKVCVDCDGDIEPARAEIALVVRCFECQEDEDKRDARRYL
jgi:RNA polymerase-binding transcription factor DksA